MNTINISSQTREYAQNHNAIFTNAPNFIPTNLPKYMTRMQDKIWANARIILPENTSFNDIVNLAFTMQKEIPYIQRYSISDSNKNHSLIISLNEFFSIGSI